MNAKNIALSNRTKKKSLELKNIFNDLEILEWGELNDFDMIINDTSLGLNVEDQINLDFSKVKNKSYFFEKTLKI